MSGDCNECKHRVYLPSKSGKLIASCDTLKCRFEKVDAEREKDNERTGITGNQRGNM